MIEEQKIIDVDVKSLVSKVKELFDSGCRLVQISATKVPAGLEINYSFDKNEISLHSAKRYSNILMTDNYINYYKEILNEL